MARTLITLIAIILLVAGCTSKPDRGREMSAGNVSQGEKTAKPDVRPTTTTDQNEWAKNQDRPTRNATTSAPPVGTEKAREANQTEADLKGSQKEYLATPAKVSIPARLAGEAKRTFDANLPYFIWSEEAQPIGGNSRDVPGMSTVIVRFSYAKAPSADAIQWKSIVRVSAFDLTEKKMIDLATFLGGHVDDLESGKHFGALLAEGRKLSGEGTIKIYLVRATEERVGAEPISNELTLRVKFFGADRN